MDRKSRDDSILGMLFEAFSGLFTIIPPWICLPLAPLAWFGISFLINRKVTGDFQIAGHLIGFMFTAAILAGGFSGWKAQRKRWEFLSTNLDNQWIKNLSWREFEEQVAAVYQRKGYTTELLGGNQPDGGVDIRLEKDGTVTLVQCKHWKAWKVGVKVVRELYGVMQSEGENSGILISSGKFTEEARQFSQGKPITLIEQDSFLELIKEFQRDLCAAHGLQPNQSNTPRELVKREIPVIPVSQQSFAQIESCPICGKAMVKRTAQRGPNAGKEFLGCTGFPSCRGTRNVSA